MIIPLKVFTGEFPRMKPHLLPDFAAQTAVDCDFVDGSLRGCRSDDLVAGVSGSNIKSLFCKLLLIPVIWLLIQFGYLRAVHRHFPRPCTKRPR